MTLPEQAPHIPHIPVPDLKGSLKWALTHWKPVGLALATFAGGIYLALAQDRGPQSPPQEPNKASDTIKPPQEGQPSVGLVPAVEPTPTAPPTPEPTKPPEVKTGNGSIIPAELSLTGVMREFEYQGQVYKLVLYNLPDGTPITAPKDGYFVARQAGGNPFIGSDLSVFNPVDLTVPHIGLRGSLQVVNRFSRDVKAGEVIAHIQDTGEKMFGEYNFVIFVTALDTNSKFFSPEEPYKEYLPILPKGPKIVQTQQVQPSSSGNVYLPKAN